MIVMCECGELGEFSNEICMSDSLADPFFEPESYSSIDSDDFEQSMKEVRSICANECCVNMLHYA